jgi:hypothetical protein
MSTTPTQEIDMWQTDREEMRLQENTVSGNGDDIIAYRPVGK